MNAPHTDCIADFKRPVLFHAFLPVFPQNLPVLSLYGIVVARIRISFLGEPGNPFTIVGTHQHVAMRGSDDNPHALRQRAVFPLHVKRIDVHRRPYVVRFQPKKKFEYFFISLSADGILFHARFRPGFQFLFIIDKNSPVFHRRPVRHAVIFRQGKAFFCMYWHVRPKIPGRNAELLT